MYYSISDCDEKKITRVVDLEYLSKESRDGFHKKFYPTVGFFFFFLPKLSFFSSCLFNFHFLCFCIKHFLGLTLSLVYIGALVSQMQYSPFHI